MDHFVFNEGVLAHYFNKWFNYLLYHVSGPLDLMNVLENRSFIIVFSLRNLI